MTTSRFAIPRRTLLRGLLGGMAAAVALPPLEAMLNSNGTAYANGTPIPKRFGIFYWGNGVRPEHWKPDGYGAVWTPKHETVPLAALNAGGARKVSILSGFNMPIKGVGHHAGRAVGLTGTYDPAKGTYGGPTGPSVDQVIADRMWQNEADRPLHKYLAVGISERGKSNSKGGFTVSMDDTGGGIAPDYSPKHVFETLFGTLNLADAKEIARKDLRMSILDAVREDAKSLQKRLGTQDSLRVAQHLESIHELELSLGANGVVCAKPSSPEDFPYDANHEQLDVKNAAMAKVVAMAMACDLTRVVTYRFTGAQSDTMFWMDPISATEGCHVMTHDDRNDIPDSEKKDPQLEKIDKAVRYVTEQFAVLLKEFDAIPEGDGTLLDNSLIFGSSEHSDATKHSVDDMPIVLAGSAGGALEAGLHFDGKGASTSRVLLTCMHAVGVKESSFGQGAAQSSEPLTDLMKA